MTEYLDMDIKREYSRYPTGLKHYRKDELFESDLFSLDLIAYKLKGLAKGVADEVVRKHGAEEGRTSQEVRCKRSKGF